MWIFVVFTEFRCSFEKKGQKSQRVNRVLSQSENALFHAQNQVIRFIGNVTEKCNDLILFGKDIALLLPLAVDAEAVFVLPEKESVTALPVHLLDGSGPSHIVLRNDPVSFIRPAVVEKQSNLAQIIHGQLQKMTCESNHPDVGRTML